MAPSTVENWESHLENWINPNIGDMPLGEVNNLAMKQLVAKLVSSGKLGPKSIGNYTQVVKMVVGSAVNEQGEGYPSPEVESRVHGRARPKKAATETTALQPAM